MFLFALIVLVVIAIGLVVALAVRFLKDDQSFSHPRLVRDVMRTYGFEENTGNMSLSIEATAELDGLSVELDFGLDSLGYEVLMLGFEVEAAGAPQVHVISQNIDPTARAQGLGDPIFDASFQCLEGVAHTIATLDHFTRSQMLSFVSAPQRTLQWSGTKLIAERRCESSMAEFDDVAIRQFFKDAIATARALKHRCELSVAQRLNQQFEDTMQPIAWRQAALKNMLLDDIPDLDRQALFWRFARSETPPERALQDVVYLYSLDMFERAHWDDDLEWVSAMIGALDVTTHREVFEALAPRLLESCGPAVLDVPMSDNARGNLYRYAYRNGYADRIVQSQVEQLAPMAAASWSERVEWLASLGVALPLQMLDDYAQAWRQHIAVSYVREADPIPALAKAVMVWPAQQAEPSVLRILSIASSEAHELCFQWLEVHGTRSTLGLLHALSQKMGQPFSAKRLAQVIDAIRARVDDGTVGGISLSAVESGDGKLSMLEHHGQVTMVEASPVVLDLDEPPLEQAQQDVAVEAVEVES